jgi:prefoldin beta subunit
MDPRKGELMQMAYKEYMKELGEVTKSDQALVGPRGQYSAQLEENKAVEREFKKLDDDAVIWKQIGPALVKQDPSEAKANVANRIKYIQGELTGIEKQLKENEKKRATLYNKVQELQQAMKDMQQQQAAPQGGQKKAISSS